MVGSENKSLIVLSASAGSGKTYKLVMTYLGLILGSEDKTSNFSSIMAMTFTNKAATEMKHRIIDSLDSLANCDDLNKKDVDYLNSVSEHLKIEKHLIKFRAKLVLKQILHQYENFNVLTIDKFNLRLIRSFSRDLNINNDFQTSTNEKDILGQIIDQLFSEINQENYERLTQIVLKYSKENIDNEEKWDFKTEIKNLAGILIKEQNFEHVNRLLEMDFSLERYEDVKSQITELKKELSRHALKLHAAFFGQDTSNFPGASNTVKAFDKLLDKNLFDNKNEYYFTDTILKSLRADVSKKTFPEEIKSLGLTFTGFFNENLNNYQKLNLFKKDFFNLALLQLIAKELDNYKKTDNIVLISEFNKLISELLKNEDAPYIYERLGNRYKHFLLDEFQDTSLLQWTNLIPLVHESLGNQNQNLIVGDPKQSIYRFKNGLAEQFTVLPALYNPENDLKKAQKSNYFEEMGAQIPLLENWRSKKEVVEFNNLFFELFRDLNAPLMDEFYKAINQIPKGEAGGFVSLSSFFEDKDKNKEIDEKIDENSFLLEWINDCKKDGYDNGDICILDYTSKNCNLWAKYLNSKGFKVVSADSLLLGSDPFVKLAMAFVKWRLNPIGDLEAKLFSEMYYEIQEKKTAVELDKFWKTKKYEEKEFHYFDSDEFLKLEFGSSENFFFHYENLYQLIQKFLLLGNLKELNNPYLHQLSDYAFQFDLNFGPDLALFIENFNNDGHRTPVQIPENKEAIKVMTAHKSKGLEFPIVLVPSLSWSIMNAQGRYLIQDENYYFYTTISKNAQLESIKEYYHLEYDKAFLDKINLNYVVFTRAKDRLYIQNDNRGNQSDSNFQKKFHEICEHLPHVEIVKNKLIYQHGEKSKKKIISSSKSKISSEFIPLFSKDNLWFPDISIQNNDLLDEDSLSEQRRFGNQLHELLSIVEDISELSSCIDSMILKGKMEIEFKSEILEKALEILNLQTYQSLFVNAKSVLREQDIIISENQIKRPDLLIIKGLETLVIDYKTGSAHKSHQKQVQEYCKALKAMEYPNIKGLIFYTNELEFTDIKFQN
jgi:ATP-dependent exoDNAse (exonuclease V) beta subunit